MRRRQARFPGRAFVCPVASWVAMTVAACFYIASCAALAGQSPTEYQVKAAYLFNFFKFVEWPDDPSADVHAKWVIGFTGESPVGNELGRLVEGKNVLGRE